MLIPIFQSDERLKRKIEIMKKPLNEKEITNEKPADNFCRCGNVIKAKLTHDGLLKARWKLDTMCRECRYTKTTGERIWELSDKDLQQEFDNI